MRKEYIKPRTEVVEIAMGRQLLAGSTPGYGGGSDVNPQAPEYFRFDDVDEIELNY